MGRAHGRAPQGLLCLPPAALTLPQPQLAYQGRTHKDVEHTRRSPTPRTKLKLARAAGGLRENRTSDSRRARSSRTRARTHSRAGTDTSTHTRLSILCFTGAASRATGRVGYSGRRRRGRGSGHCRRRCSARRHARGGRGCGVVWLRQCAVAADVLVQVEPQRERHLPNIGNAVWGTGENARSCGTNAP